MGKGQGLLVDCFDARQIPLTVADTLQRRAELIRLGRAARQHNFQECDLQTRCLPAQVELLRRIGEAAIP